MNTPLFPDGIKGLADSKFSAYEGECDKLVGIDFRSTPGIIKPHQKLTKVSGSTVTDLCKNVVELEDGKKIWFSSESGKIWQQAGDTFTLLHTIVPATDYKERNSIVAGLEKTPEYEDTESGITMSIAENSAGYGNISNNVQSTFDTNIGQDISSCELSSGYYALAYKGTDNDGFIKTFQISASDTFSLIESLEHDTIEGSSNSLRRIDDNHLILAYESGSVGVIKTFSANYGSIIQIGNLTHESYYTTHNSLVQIDATHYALALTVENKPYINILTSSGWSLASGWSGDYNTGFNKTNSGTAAVTSSFVPTVGKQYEVSFTLSNVTAYDVEFSMGGFTSNDYNANGNYSFTTTACTTTAVFQFLTDNTSARLTVSNIKIKELKNGGLIKIFTIDGGFNVTQTSEMWFSIDNLFYGNELALIDSTHLMLSTTNGSANQIIKTFTIDGSWNVTESDSLTHGASGNLYSKLLKYDATHYIWSGMIQNRGYIKIFTIDGSYQITETFGLDIKTVSYSPALLRNDETHIVLASNGSSFNFIKVFEISPSYIMKEISHSDFSGGQDISILRGTRKLIIPNSVGYINVATMNETYSNGIILTPFSGEINLVASKFVSQLSSIDQYLKTTIKVPEGYSNLRMVVITGRGGSETYPSTSVTLNGGATSQHNTRTSAYGFKCSSAYYTQGIMAGDNEIIVEFGTETSYMYAAVLIFSNVHPMLPISATVDYGWKDYLQLPGTTKGELRIGAFLTKINPHYSGDLQKEALQEDIAETIDRYTFSVSMRKFGIGTAKTLGASLFSYLTTEVVGNENESYVPEEQKQKIYYANEDILFAVPVDKISAWASNVETIGEFRYGDDTYHPIVKQNLELYIGDKTVLAKVNSDGDFIPETTFNVRSPERIQIISSYDTDVLVGTKTINKARVLRWDTFSDSWIADDDVIETGINAFILDDDYTYVSAGDFGHIYFYNGEKLNITKKIPGIWDSTHKGKINPNAVGYLKGTPVFGLSNVTGNPTLQGIYGFGGYDSKYPKSLSLDYPLPTNEFTGVEIGSINVNGSDMYVSYRTVFDVGVAKLDYTAKYNNAYLETALLGSLKDRDDYTIHEGICADYISLPANTEVEVSVKTKYNTNYTELDTIVDAQKLSIKTKASIPDTLNLQIKLNLVSSGNNSPELDNVGIL